MPTRVVIYTLIMIVLWGSHAGVSALTMASGGSDPLTRHALLFYKLLFAAVCLFITLAAMGRLKVLRSYSRTRLAKLAFAGAFGYFLYYFCYFWGFERAIPRDAVAEATIINYLFPMCTLFASAALIGERLTLRAIAAALIAFAGAYIVATKGKFVLVSSSNADVDFLMLGAAISWGVFSALGRRWRCEPLTGMFIFVCTGLVLSGLVLPFTSGRCHPIGWEFYGCFHIGFLCNTVGTILWFLALKHGGASLAGNLSLLASFLSLVFIRILVPNQTIAWSAVVGLAVIILGVALSRTGARRPVEPAGETEPPA
jgi:drug/metabolite transporter (DMT)-like permease